MASRLKGFKVFCDDLYVNASLFQLLQLFANLRGA